MFRVGIITKAGKVMGKSFPTKEEADNYVLSVAEKEGVKKYRILDKETKEIVDKGEGI